MITAIAASRCILELCSFFKRNSKPSKANLKLPNLDFSENFFVFMNSGIDIL
jgi:hypothetical protein